MIEIVNLQKSFKSYDGCEKIVFENASATIDNTKTTGIIGENGEGKTTLLRIIASLDKDYQGTIKMPCDLKPLMVFQKPYLMPFLNVYDNITFSLKNKKKLINERKTEIDKIISLLGLSSFLHKYPSELSLGFQMRTSLARVLIANANFLLLDETFASLDKEIKEVIKNYLKEINKNQKCGVLLVSHNENDMFTFCDEIFRIKDKKIEKIINEASYEK